MNDLWSKLRAVGAQTRASSKSDDLDKRFYDVTYSMQVIEYDMLNKWRFYPLALAWSLTVRGALYPLSVIKTRIQVQKQNTVYSQNLFRTLKDIYRNERIPGLYKGYWVSTPQVATGVLYVGLYEFSRHQLKDNNLVQDGSLRSLFAGGIASACCQTVAVPCDIVSQHMMIIGNLRERIATDGQIPSTSKTAIHNTHDPYTRRVADPLNLARKVYELEKTHRIRIGGLTYLVCREVWRRDGFFGYYRGYISSLMLYVPNAAIFWYTYHKYCQFLSPLLVGSKDFKLLSVQAMCGPCAGITTSILTNALDVYRARIQVHRLSYLDTAKKLWHDERWTMFTKGLSARLVSSCIFSVFMIVGYESLKRISVSDEFSHSIRW